MVSAEVVHGFLNDLGKTQLKLENSVKDLLNEGIFSEDTVDTVSHNPESHGSPKDCTPALSASKTDTSLFYKVTSSASIYFLIYVDGILVTGSSSTTVNQLIHALGQEFAIKDLGPLHFFLGIHATSTSAGLHLSQEHYITNLLVKTKMKSSNPCSTPFATVAPPTQSPDFDDLVLYRSTVGALQYATITRPYITFAVNKACQHMQYPSEADWSAVKRILRYLNDRRSTSGMAIFMGPNLISWCSRKQKIVSRSSTEAEYRALVDATSE
ncbi:uncharacterized protein LOC113355458 [Papaver somniferum]|uniref:uncharacterized protein LOC113355458 n=1 Tax=Papaver somniferum TaxID=3469 RepID=UPI000E6F50F9|nr:uncharacterized protein LOC113355458 [Papaver somniferum]